MNRTELVAEMAKRSEVSKKDADALLKAFVEITKETLSKGEAIQLIGFGTFETTNVPERTGKIMMGERKGEEYTTPAHRSPRFKASKALKEAVNN